MHIADLLIISGYFILIVFSALFRRKKSGSASEFIMAGRNLTLFPFVATLVSTAYGWVLGIGQLYYTYGVSAWFFLSLPYTLTALLLGFFFSEKARKTDAITLSDILSKTYDRRVGNLGNILMLVYTAPFMYVLMAAQIIWFVSAWPMWLCILLSIFFSVVYVYAGGFRSVVQANFFQFLLMFFGFAVAALFLYLKFGGQVLKTLPDQLTHAKLSYSVPYIVGWFLLALITLVDPAYYQRIFATSNARTAKWGVIISVAWWTLFDFLAIVVALYSRALIPDLQQAQFSYPELIGSFLPPLVGGIFAVSLLSTVMSTSNSYLFLTSLIISKDLLHGNNWFKGLSVQNLTRWVISGMCLLCFVICMWYRNESAVDIFFDFIPVVTSAMLLPVLSFYFKRLSMPSSWVLFQMGCSIFIVAGYQLAGKIFPEVMGDNSWIFDEFNPAYPGLFTALMVQIFYLLFCKHK